jgi:hypothetical protein
MALDPTLVKILDDFADSMIALRLPALPFGSSNPKIGTALDAAIKAAGTAASDAYTPTVPGDWSPAPTTTGDALDQEAARLSAAETTLGTTTTTANAALPAAKLVVRTGTVPAGSATPTASVTGLLTTDTILAVDQITPNANSLPLIGRAASCAVNGQLALDYSADPGAGGTISVLVKTA